ncbi:hypothetical protein [Petroclostridium sp. X23]|jgi:hypothetical protein|uniref:hypothetical protein n=1 Tax=Petroclostridium sp. X23 TaxID=3045146 RepID=UPI0024ACE01F|nr:hypothetical protein [Petroclostridium sp. X23]WHH60191.1 hypothetical protein QKW49_05505 [Petroclostridium sp. X23]
MLNSVLETRSVNDGLHRIMIEIPEKEFEAVYDQYTNDIASEFLTYYLENRNDDGKPSDIQIKHDKNGHVVRIVANIHYLENEHTSYSRQYGSYFEDIEGNKYDINKTH